MGVTTSPLHAIVARHNNRLRFLKGQKSEAALFMASQFIALVECPSFSCVGAKAAFAKNSFRVAVYESMNSKDSLTHLHNDLSEFIESQEAGEFKGRFSTFSAIFKNAEIEGEIGFHNLLWRLLNSIANLNAEKGAPWARDFSADVESPRFAFSHDEHALFVVGLHAHSSRLSRRFAFPTLIFNLHSQFQELRKDGKYEEFRDRIRERDLHLQGCLNPMLADHGEKSEATQYSGAEVDSPSECPFRIKN